MGKIGLPDHRTRLGKRADRRSTRNGRMHRDTLATMAPNWRSQFPILETTTYLASHNQGAMSFASSDLLAQFAEDWATLGSSAWDQAWSNLPFEVGNTIGTLVGASPQTTVATTGMMAAFVAIDSCFRFQPAQSRFVTTQLEHSPGRRYWQRQAGLTEAIVRSWDGRTIATETLLAEIDERTAIVMLSDGPPSGSSIDLKRVVAAAHDVDGYVLLDCSQSAGAVPIDIEDLGVDFAVGRTDGWLCGGASSAWLYVHPEILGQLEPQTPGWGIDGDPTWPDPDPSGIGRFLDGPPNPAALYALTAGLDPLFTLGIENIRQRSLAATGNVIELAESAGMPVTSDTSEDRGAIVTLQVDDAFRVQSGLQALDILVGAYSPDEISIGPHFYNNQADLDTFISTLKSINHG